VLEGHPARKQRYDRQNGQTNDDPKQQQFHAVHVGRFTGTPGAFQIAI
jgi:hypothetical protein